jgi:two-component system OmpR family response regulator
MVAAPAHNLLRKGAMAPVSGHDGRVVTSSARLLVVDDEENIRDLVATGLRYQGYEVATAADGRSALAQAEVFRPDLIVLDVSLPDIDGFRVCDRLQGLGQAPPIIFLTARRTLEDKLTGLSSGGDDYITKPFSLQELHARVRVVLRRTRAAPDAPRRLRVGDLELDVDTCTVRRAGDQVTLTPTEFKLLRCLMEHAGQVLSKEQLLDLVWNYDFDGNVQVVETYVYYLRKKLDRTSPPMIHTVRGFGYALRARS